MLSLEKYFSEKLNKKIDNAQKCITAAKDLANKSPLKDHLQGKEEFTNAITRLNAIDKDKLKRAHNTCNELSVAKEPAATDNKEVTMRIGPQRP